MPYKSESADSQALTEACPHPHVVRQRGFGGSSLAAHDLHVGRHLEGELFFFSQVVPRRRSENRAIISHKSTHENASIQLMVKKCL